MYVVIGTWELDPARTEECMAALNDKIVPAVREMTGLVKGYWAGGEGGGRSYSFTVFDDETTAQSFVHESRARATQWHDIGLRMGDIGIIPLAAQT